MIQGFFSSFFSNTGWPYKFSSGLAAIALLCLWSWHNGPTPMLEDCLANPMTCDGKLWTANAGGIVAAIEPQRFWLDHEGVYIQVVGQIPDLRVGDTIFMEAIFHREGYWTLQQAYISRYRNVRIWVSLVSMVGVLWFFFRSYRFDLPCRVFARRSGGKGNA